MNREETTQKIREAWRELLPTMADPAKSRANGETSYICPLCGHGKNGDGLTFNPKSRDGNGLKCFGCNFTGDIIDLYRQISGTDHNTALATLADRLSLSIDPAAPSPARQTAQRDPERERQPRPEPDYSRYYETCITRLTDPDAQRYLSARGISERTARALFIGFDPAADPASAPGAAPEEYKPHPCPRLIIPCSPDYYIARRTDGGQEYKKLMPKGSTAAFFNRDALKEQDAQEVFITEAAIDALSIIEAGAPAMALNSAAYTDKLLQDLERERPRAALILCLDNDGAGKRATVKLTEGLERLAIPFFDATAEICGGAKDANEALTADRAAFIEAVESARQQARALTEARAREDQNAEAERSKRTGAGMVDAFIEAVQTRKYAPMPTGIAEIDRAIGGGFIRQQLVLLGAAPGAGKTALAQWIFESMAERGISSVYLNLEMSRDQMLSRSIARLTARRGHAISATRIMQGYSWTGEERRAVMEAAEEYKASIADHLIYNPDGVTADLDSIMRYLTAEAERAERQGEKAPCIILDYLQIVNGDPREDAASLIKRAVITLKEFAIKHETLVFVIIAHNRASNSSGTVSMESGRDTSALEYSADLQLALTYTACLKRGQNSPKNPDNLTQNERKKVTLIVTKGRFGGAGQSVDLLFTGETMSYTRAPKASPGEGTAPAEPEQERISHF